MGLKIKAEVVVLDIEGTVCPITFVKDVLFPYALSALPDVLSSQWDSSALAPYIAAFPAEHRSTPSDVLAHVRDLMSRDVKIAYLKSLQGYLWTEGYASGALRAPLFADVEPALRKWHEEQGTTLVIYSSGSVVAQKLLFQHTNSSMQADLTPLLNNYFDTVNAGPKTEKSSYETIAKSKSDIEVGKWLFFSDNVKEVEAAKEAGWQALVVVREGNAPLSEQEKRAHTLVSSFEEVEVVTTKSDEESVLV